MHLGDTQLGGQVEANGPRFGHDAAGRYWLTWYNSRNPLGVYLLQFDPTTGQPIGSAALAPKSTDPLNFGDGRMALACAAQCRVVYHEADAQGNNTPYLDSWGAGDADSTRVTGPVQPNVSVAASAVPNGGMWIVWHEDGTPAYHAELASASGAGGVNHNIGQPTKHRAAGAEHRDDGARRRPRVRHQLARHGPDHRCVLGARDPGDRAPLHRADEEHLDEGRRPRVLTLASPKNCVPAGTGSWRSCSSRRSRSATARSARARCSSR